MSDHSGEKNATEDTPNLDRRRMLMRLGLAATAIYSAPVLLQLNEAHASGGSGGGRGGGSGGGRGGGGRGSGGRGSGGRGRGGRSAGGFGGRGSWGSGGRRGGGNRGTTSLGRGLMRDMRKAFGG